MSRHDDTDEAAPYVSRVDRRTTLAWLGATGALGPTLAKAQSPNDRQEKPVVAAPQTEEPGPRGYGTDPALVSPKPAPWPRIMTEAQLQTAALLCDFVLPASGASPSATSLGVPDFLDEWISAPYPQQTADRPVVLEGLAWVEGEAQRRHGRPLLGLSAADRVALLTPLTVRSADPAAAKPHAFFRRFRSLVVGAYFTTPAGFKEIGYIGNVARSSDPGPSPEAAAAVDAALRSLGL